MTDGLCPNIFVLQMCSRICSEHNPEFSASLLSHFEFVASDSEGTTAIQTSDFHACSEKLRQAHVAPAITLSLHILYSGILQAIFSKSESTSEFEARLQASNLALTNSEVMPFFALAQDSC
jgi:hypothetical protein